MVHCKNWDRALLRAQAIRAKKRHRPTRCRCRGLKSFATMEMRT